MSDSGAFALAALVFAGLGWWWLFGIAILFAVLAAIGDKT